MNKFFIYAGIAAIALAFLLGMQTCNCYSKKKAVAPDTASMVVKYDSTRLLVDTFYTPSPVKIDTVYRPVYVVHYVPVTDSFIAYEKTPVDTAAILKDYYSSYIYSDPVYVRNGSIKGAITINDTISRNKIQGRGVVLDFEQITTTKEIVLKQPKTSIGYIGFDAVGNRFDPMQGGGLLLGMKTRNEHFYAVGIDFLKNNMPLYRIQTFIPLRFSDKNK